MNSFPPTSSSNGDLITKKELAARLHKSPRCIELWMKRKYIPYLKVRRSVLFSWPEVLKALERFHMGPEV